MSASLELDLTASKLKRPSSPAAHFKGLGLPYVWILFQDASFVLYIFAVVSEHTVQACFLS